MMQIRQIDNAQSNTLPPSFYGRTHLGPRKLVFLLHGE
jgi:hypothetical protein